MDELANDILDFWFGAPGSAERGQSRPAWFRKDPAFDDEIRRRFGHAVDDALGGRYAEWGATAHGALALVILQDQFTRNIFRDTPRAFAGDARALGVAEDAVDRGLDRKLAPRERWFLYMPFEHAEDVAMQRRSLVLFEALSREMGDAGPLEWARKHADVIFRFGRYPHRNALLGRASSAEEAEYLAAPGAGF